VVEVEMEAIPTHLLLVAPAVEQVANQVLITQEQPELQDKVLAVELPHHM